MAAPLVQAAVLTFEGQNNTICTVPITRSGFLVGNVVGDEQHFHEITSTRFGLPSNGTGIMLNDRNTRIFIEDVLGADFTLSLFDVASALSNLPAIGITIEGFNNGFSSGNISLASLGNGYTTLDGAGLGNVDRVVFDGFGGGGVFVLDNVNLGAAVNDVPEPGSPTPLLVAGLAALQLRQAGRV
jgi:hypothetical protein